MTRIQPSPSDATQSIGEGPTSENAALIAAMESLHGAETALLTRPAAGEAHVLVLPKGMEARSIKPFLDEYLDKPERVRGTARLSDVVSFIDHVKRFQRGASAVFVDPNRTQPTFTAVYDYHPAHLGGDEQSAADWLQHRGVYAPALSDQWKAWNAGNGKAMGQADFAQFIEDHATDLIVPNLDDPDLKTFASLVGGRFAEPSDLVQLSRGLQINVESVVKNAVTLATGEIAVQYEEVHRDGGGQPIQVPNLFQICIPVFYAGANYKLPVRLRYRKAGPNLMWSYLLVRPEMAFDDAIVGIKAKVEEETVVDVFLGAVEA